MKFVTLILISCFLIGCATINSRRLVYKSDLTIKAGSFGDTIWTDSLVFERTSWYEDSTMEYEILIAELNEKTPFHKWLDGDLRYLKECKSMKIALVYSDINARLGVSFVVDKIRRTGYDDLTLLDFTHNFRAHQNAQDWNLTQHKIVGLCDRDGSKKSLEIALPGFKSQTL